MGNLPPPEATHLLLAASSITRIYAEADILDWVYQSWVYPLLHTEHSLSTHSLPGTLLGPGDTEMMEAQPSPKVARSCRRDRQVTGHDTHC